MSKWVTCFAQSQCGNKFYKTKIGGRTYKSVIETAISGEKIRLRFGAVYDRNDIKVLSVTASANDNTAQILVGGQKAFTVKKNATILSDEAVLNVEKGDKIEIRSYFADGTVVMTGCKVASEYSVPGDYTNKEFVPSEENVWLSKKRPFDIGTPMPLVYGVDVLASENAYAVAVFGASNEYIGKWVEPFTKEMSKRFGEVSVCNMSISGGRVLKGTGNKLLLGNLFGDSGIKRFPRDVAALSGVKYVLIELGGNDVFQSGSFACYPWDKCPSAEKLEAGMNTLIEEAKKAGIIPIVLTLSPMKYGDKWNEEKLAVRNAFNERFLKGESWLCFDFAKYVRDEKDPDALREDYHLGDHVHLNDAAGKAVVENFDYSLFGR